MNRKLGRYCKRVIAFVSAFVVFFAGIYLTSFSSEAAEYYEFYMNFPEPAKGDGQGYIVLMLENMSTGEIVPSTFFWSTYGVANGLESISYGECILANTSSGSTFEFTVSAHTGTTSGLYTLYIVTADCRYILAKHSSTERYYYNFDGYRIIGWVTAGDSYVHGVDVEEHRILNVYFNEDNTAVLLMELIATLSHNSTIDQSILNTVNSILNSVNDVEGQLSSVISYLQSIDSELDSIKSKLQEIYDKADDILNEQKKSNTWLEKIYNKIVEALGLQGEESTEKLPDEEVDSVLEEEDKLMQDTTDAENSLDFSVDSNSNNVVWNVIERVLNANPRVFGAFIGIMTLGVITLLLNR